MTFRTYIYTEYGEEHAAAMDLDVRKAGSIARFGFRPLHDHPLIAAQWEGEGFVESIEINAEDYFKIYEAFKDADVKEISVQYPLTPEQIETGRRLHKEKHNQRLQKGQDSLL